MWPYLATIMLMLLNGRALGFEALFCDHQGKLGDKSINPPYSLDESKCWADKFNEVFGLSGGTSVECYNDYNGIVFPRNENKWCGSPTATERVSKINQYLDSQYGASNNVILSCLCRGDAIDRGPEGECFLTLKNCNALPILRKSLTTTTPTTTTTVRQLQA